MGAIQYNDFYLAIAGIIFVILETLDKHVISRIFTDDFF